MVEAKLTPLFWEEYKDKREKEGWMKFG